LKRDGERIDRRPGTRVMNRNFIFMAFYLSAVLLLTTLHSITLLICSAFILAVLSGRSFARHLMKTLAALFIFNSVVSLSYVIFAFSRGDPVLPTLFMINARTYVLTFSTFLLVDRINLFSAFSFSRTLTLLLILSYGQIMTFRRILFELWFSLRSRTISRPGVGDLWKFVSSTTYFFLNCSVSNSKEIVQAMKSRGFLYD